MNKQEFMSKVAEVTPKEKQIQEVPDREYSIIEKVYTFHPAISETEGKRQIAELYVNFGMALIMDMVPRAELMANVGYGWERSSRFGSGKEERKAQSGRG